MSAQYLGKDRPGAVGIGDQYVGKAALRYRMKNLVLMCAAGSDNAAADATEVIQFWR